MPRRRQSARLSDTESARPRGAIISASRRTDIPRFYGRWFSERRRAGRAEFRTSFGVPGSVSLRNEDVLGYLFWTRYAAPFAEALRALQQDGIPCVFQYTITGYGDPVEPYLPPARAMFADFARLSARLPGPCAIEWRYDPIVLNDRFNHAFHVRNFTALAGALAGATRVVNTSVVEPYLRTVRRLDDAEVHFRAPDPERHAALARRRPDLLAAGEDARALLAELAEIASAHGLELRSCANPEWPLPASQCCSAAMFAPYGERIAERFMHLAPAPSRPGCRCLKVVDIGMDNTCPAGCRYCYVVTSQKTAVANFRNHDRAAVRLR